MRMILSIWLGIVLVAAETDYEGSGDYNTGGDLTDDADYGFQANSEPILDYDIEIDEDNDDDYDDEYTSGDGLNDYDSDDEELSYANYQDGSITDKLNEFEAEIEEVVDELVEVEDELEQVEKKVEEEEEKLEKEAETLFEMENIAEVESEIEKEIEDIEDDVEFAEYTYDQLPEENSEILVSINDKDSKTAAKPESEFEVTEEENYADKPGTSEFETIELEDDKDDSEVLNEENWEADEVSTAGGNEVMTAILAGAGVGILIAFGIIIFIYHRIKKKDEGSYRIAASPSQKESLLNHEAYA